MASEKYNTCNVKINNEHYYNESGPRIASSIASMAWTFPQLLTCTTCCVCLTVIFGILVALNTNYIALGIFGVLILCCCLSSAYNGYKFYSAKTELTNSYNNIQSDTKSRPCIDKSTNKIYR